MADVVSDLRWASRKLLRQPALTVTVLLILAVGLGGGTALFSVARSVLLQPLPYPAPDRLVLVWEKYPPGGYDQLLVSGPDFHDLAQDSRSFESLAAFDFVESTLTGEGPPEVIEALAVTPELFGLIGTEPALGHRFPTAEEHRDSTQVVLSHRLWRDRFGGDREILGRRLLLSGEPHTVIGVMGEGFRFPPPFRLGSRNYGTGTGASLLVSIPRARLHGDRARRQLMVIGRLRSNTSLERANRELALLTAGLSKSHPDTNPEGLSAFAVPLHDQAVGQVRPTLLLSLTSVALLVLIACANVANLLLARTVDRQPELAVRAALGAGSGRLTRLLLTESLLLGLAGGALGLSLAWGLLQVLAGLELEYLPRLAEVELEGTAVLFTVGLSLVTSVLFGLAPALRSRRPDLMTDLHSGRAESLHRGGFRLLRRFVVVQLALSLSLLGAAGLMVKSFWALRHVDLGFDPGGTLIASVTVPEYRYPEPGDRDRLREELLHRIEALPGVEAVGATTSLPLSALFDSSGYSIEGRSDSRPDESSVALLQHITPGYAPAIGLRLRRGRWLRETDGGPAPTEVLVSSSLAERSWPAENPIGRRLRLSEDNKWHQVVGVVDDVKLRGVDAADEPTIYPPLEGHRGRRLLMVVRSAPGGSELAPELRSATWSVDPDLPVEIFPFQERLTRNLAQPRLGATLLALLAGIAMTLAAVGTWGMISYTTRQRRHELGIRITFGASRSQALSLILSSAVRLVIGSVLVGLVGAAVAGKLLAHYLSGVPAFDAVVLTAATLLLIIVGLASAYFPARRIIPRDPTVLLDSK